VDKRKKDITVKSSMLNKLDICGVFFEHNQVVKVPVVKLDNERFAAKFKHALSLGILKEV
jgi:hypothetical protein